MLKILARIQESYQLPVSFYSSEDHQKFNMAKSKVIFFKITGN